MKTVVDLPLLTKELVERAARQRTYWMRVVVAAILYLFFWSDNRYRFRSSNPTALLGIGDDLFQSLTILLFFGIYAFVPATMCGAITHEKERDSLVLLLLTPLKPWRIILQKYFGGLIPSLTILILALPLGAVCYTFGGFTPRELAWTIGILFLAILQVGALAVWCSALFRTTGAAFIGTYAFGAMLYLAPAAMVLINEEWHLELLSPYAINVAGAHLPPAAWHFVKSPGATKPEPLVCCLVMLGTTLLFLSLATWHLPRRAFASSKSLLRTLFAKIDRGLENANRVIGGLTLARKDYRLPLDEAIYWRERRARALAKPEHLTRLLLALLIPTVGLLLMGAFSMRPSLGQAEVLSVIGAGVGILAILVLAVTASNCIVTERVKQTFEVLMTTPLQGRQIVQEKARALRPLTFVLAAPLLLTFATEAWLESDGGWGSGRSTPPATGRYLFCAFASVILQLSIVSWVSIWIGMWCRTRLRALSVTLGGIIGWCVLPFVLLEAVDVSGPSDAGSILYLLSPLTLPALNEMNELDMLRNLKPWTVIVINFVWYGLIYWSLRNHCLTRADAYLRR